MPYHYYIRPNAPASTKPFSASVDSQPTVEAADFLARIAAATGSVAQADVEKVLTSFIEVAEECMSESQPVASTLGLFRIRPLLGGSYTTADPDDNSVRANADYAIHILPARKTAFRQGLSLQKSGQVGRQIPVIASVVVMPGGQANSYKAGGILEVRGQHLNDASPAGTEPTAVLMNTDGTMPVNCTVFDGSNRRLLIQVPATGVTGPKILQITDGGRVGRYGETLTQLL